MQSLWLLIPGLIILIVVIPFAFQIKITYNLHKNQGFFCLKIFIIKIKFFSFKISGKSFIIRTKTKAKQIELQFKDPKVRLIEKFTQQVKKKIKLKNMEFHSHVGTGDALETAIVSGGFETIIGTMFGLAKNFKPTGSLKILNHNSFDKKRFQVSVFLKLSISLFDIIYSFVIASIATKNVKERV